MTARTRVGSARDPGDGTGSKKTDQNVLEKKKHRTRVPFLVPSTTKDHPLREVVFPPKNQTLSLLACIRMADPSSRGKAWPTAPAQLNNQVCFFSGFSPYDGHRVVLTFSRPILPGIRFWSLSTRPPNTSSSKRVPTRVQFFALTVPPLDWFSSPFF